jgi:hypothetical protein
MSPTPTVFQSTRSCAPVDLTLWSVAAAAAFFLLLAFAAFQRLHLL